MTGIPSLVTCCLNQSSLVISKCTPRPGMVIFLCGQTSTVAQKVSSFSLIKAIPRCILYYKKQLEPLWIHVIVLLKN